MPPNFTRVKVEDEFIIPFKGLGVGNHTFKFEIEKEFFDSFEYFEDVSGSAKVDVELLRESNMLIFEFAIEGDLSLKCDRCLGFFDHKIKALNKLIIKFGDKFLEESEDVMVIPVNENRIDLKQYIFEYISLQLPFKKSHPIDKDGFIDCDPDIIDRINEYSKPTADPRWDALKDIEL